MTKRKMFTGLRNVIENSEASAFVFEGETVTADEVIKFIDHEIELLEKRNASKSSKPSKNQIANEGIKARIADVLAEVEEPVTVTEIIGLMGENFNNQKISALLRQMGNVKKEYVKGKAVFSLA